MQPVDVAERCALASAIARAATEVRLVANTSAFGTWLYPRLRQYFTQEEEELLIDKVPPESNPEDILNTIGATGSLLKSTVIPDALTGDEVFSKYICPITQWPIRDPARDPNGKTLYERQAIYAWLENHSSSPMIRQPLTRQDLTEVPLIRALIDHRALVHTKRLVASLREGREKAPCELAHPILFGQPDNQQ